MRVLLTTDTVGGVWTFTKVLTEELLKRGHAVSLVGFGRLPSTDQLAWCKRTAAHFVHFEYKNSSAPLEWMAANDRTYEEGVAALLATAEIFLPDVVHSSQFCFGALPLDVPVVVTAHSDVMSWAQACKPTGLDTSAWLTRYHFLVQRGLAAADVVVAPSQWMLAALAKNFAVPSNNAVILNGIGPLTSGNDARRLQAVSAGRFWDEGKNLSLLAEVESEVPILVAGEYEYADRTSRAATGAVAVLGALGEEKLLALFRTSAMYVAPSRYEPFGLAPLEAAQCGCALLLSDLPSFREIWGASASYFKDARDLEKLLDEISRSEILLASMQAKALERAHGMTAERMAEGYVNLYGELVRRAKCDVGEGACVA
jgi:glycogen(starch) synthase